MKISVKQITQEDQTDLITLGQTVESELLQLFRLTPVKSTILDAPLVKDKQWTVVYRAGTMTQREQHRVLIVYYLYCT